MALPTDPTQTQTPTSLQPAPVQPTPNQPLDAPVIASHGVSTSGQTITGDDPRVAAEMKLWADKGTPISQDIALGNVLRQQQPVQQQQGTVPTPAPSAPPPGWDAITYANFKKANPNLEPTAEDTARMQGKEGTGDISPDNTNKVISAVGAGHADAQDIALSTGLSLDEVNKIIQGNPELSPMMQKASIGNQITAAADTYNKQVEALNNGTFQLTPEEQAKVDEMRRLFDEMKAKQLTANKNFEGGVTINEIRSGRQEFVNEISSGIYKQAVDDGLKKINAIEMEATNAISQLKTEMKQNRYKQAAETYDRLEKTLASKSKVIDDLQKATTDMLDRQEKAQQQDFENTIKLQEQRQKAEQDAITNQFKFMDFDLKNMEAQLANEKFGYTQKQDAIQNALANDKLSWQQKQDLIQNQLDKQKMGLDAAKFDYSQGKDARDYNLALEKFQLDIKKAQAADTPSNLAEWQAMGGNASGKTYDEFLLNKGAQSEKAPTVDQAKNAGFAVRMKDANNSIALLTKQFQDMGLFGQQYNQIVPSFLKSSENQMMEQAQRDFANAILRRESGAAISPEEFNNARKQYFPQPGDKEDVIKQKERNRINALQGIVNSSGNALDASFKQNYKNTVYPNLDTFTKTYSGAADFLKKLDKAMPGISDEDALQYINTVGTESPGFSGVGGDTKAAMSPVTKVIASIPDDTKGGQCGRFVNKLTGLGVGDSYQSKISKMDPTIKTPKAGMVFTMPYKDTGHVGIILAINDGIATVKDSNYYTKSKPEQITTHTIPVSKMTGFRWV